MTCERLKYLFITLSISAQPKPQPTVCEHSGRRDLHWIDDSDVVQNRDTVAVNLSKVNKSSNVNAFWWVAHTRANSNRDVIGVAAIKRLIQIVRESTSVLQSDVNAFAERPWALNSPDQWLKYRLEVATKPPQTCWNVAKNIKKLVNFFKLDMQWTCAAETCANNQLPIKRRTQMAFSDRVETMTHSRTLDSRIISSPLYSFFLGIFHQSSAKIFQTLLNSCCTYCSENSSAQI